MEMKNSKAEKGVLRISEDVISEIAEQALKDMEEVYGVDKQNIFMSILKPAKNSVKIKPVEDIIEVSLSVKLKYGVNITKTAEKIQKIVKASIQNMTRSEVRDCAFKLIFENLLREDPLEELYATADEIKQTNIDSNPEQLGKYIISNRNIVLNSAETEEDKQKAIALLEKISELLRIEKPEYISECIWSNMDLLDEVIGIYIVREKGEIYIDRKVKKLTENVLAHAEETDSIISKFSPKREFKRIARINVAILRIAIYEINYESKNISMNSAISEAVKISQMYSQPEDTAFVNGVLGAYARSLKANENNA